MDLPERKRAFLPAMWAWVSSSGCNSPAGPGQPWEQDPVTREGCWCLPPSALGQRCSQRRHRGWEQNDGSLSCSCPHRAGCGDCRNVLSKVTLSFGCFCYRQLSWLLGLRAGTLFTLQVSSSPLTFICS